MENLLNDMPEFINLPIAFSEGTPQEPMSYYHFTHFPQIGHTVFGEENVYKVVEILHMKGQGTAQPEIMVVLEYQAPIPE